MNGCETWGESVLMLHYGELEPAEADKLRAHLPDCSDCTRAAEEVTRVAGGLDAITVPPPDPERWEQLKEDVVARL